MRLRRLLPLALLLAILVACATVVTTANSRRLEYEILNLNWATADVIFVCDHNIVLKRVHNIETNIRQRGFLNPRTCTNISYLVRLVGNPREVYISPQLQGWTSETVLTIMLQNNLQLTSAFPVSR